MATVQKPPHSAIQKLQLAGRQTLPVQSPERAGSHGTPSHEKGPHGTVRIYMRRAPPCEDRIGLLCRIQWKAMALD